MFENIITTNNRPYDINNIEHINNRLRIIPEVQRSVIISSIIEESGGDPLANGPGGYQGLLQWEPSRYKVTSSNTKEELDKQIDYILQTYKNTTDGLSWAHGGSGSGYSTGEQAYKEFMSSKMLEDAVRSFTLGYVRPTGKHESVNNRLKVARQVFDRIRRGSEHNSIYLPEIKVNGSLPWYRDLIKTFTDAMIRGAVINTRQ